MGQRSWPGISSYIGHQAHAVDLERLRDGEMLVCTFPLLPVRGGQAPQSQALSQRQALGLLSVAVLTIRGLNPGRCRGAHRVCVAMG